MKKENEEMKEYSFEELWVCHGGITGYDIYSTRTNEKESVLGSIMNPLLARKLTRISKIIQPEIDGFTEAKDAVLKEVGDVSVVFTATVDGKKQTFDEPQKKFEEMQKDPTYKNVKVLKERPVDYNDKMHLITPYLDKLMEEKVKLFLPTIPIDEFSGEKISGTLLRKIDIVISG